MPNQKVSNKFFGLSFRRIARIVKGPIEFAIWVFSRFSVPAPLRVKWSVLKRYSQPGSVWVETGTYLGTTTRFFSRISDSVYSIEPEPKLATAAARRFSTNSKVRIINDTSENALPTILQSLSGATSFWLDGHYSEGITFRGNTDTPIRLELELISKYVEALGSITVFVDDFRCFESTDIQAVYPSRSYLVKWADNHGFGWTVEHDIFVAWKERVSPQ